MHLVGTDDGEEDEDAGRGRQPLAPGLAAADAPPAGKQGPRPFPRLPPPPPRDQLFVLASSIPVSAVLGGEEDVAVLRALKAGDLLRPVWLQHDEEGAEGAGTAGEGAGEGAPPIVGLALACGNSAAPAPDEGSPPRVVAELRMPCPRAAEALVSLCRPAAALGGAVGGLVTVGVSGGPSPSSPPCPSRPRATFSVSLSLCLTPAALADAAAHAGQGYDDTQLGRQLLPLLRWLRGGAFAPSPPASAPLAPSASSAAPPPSSSSSAAAGAAATLDAASLFSAIRPPRDAPRVRGWDCGGIRGLRPSLRPYQARAVAWMASREAEQDVGGAEGGGGAHPLWERVWEEGGAAPADSATAASAAASRRRGKATRGAAAATAAAAAAAATNVATPRGKKSIFVHRVTGRVSLSAPTAPPRVRGGILADEMGLGKTVELLALILKQRQDEEEKEATAARRCGGRSGSRWTVRRAERERRERVDCPCGARGPASLADDNGASSSLLLPLGSYWIQCDECDAWCHSACCGLSRRRKPGEAEGWACGGCLHARAAEVVEGAGAAPPPASSCSPASGPSTTLIVCPTHIVGQWAGELQRHAEPGALRVVVYEGQGGFHGGSAGRLAALSPERAESGAIVLGGREGGVVGAGDLAAADVVVVSYETLAREVHRSAEGETGDAVVAAASCSASLSSRSRSFRAPKRYAALPTPLTRLVWGRAVLDEAQEVETGTTGAATLASRLAARRRWAVTGTPCGAGGTGGIDDLFGLFCFLRCDPWGVSQRVWRDGLVRPAAAAWGSRAPSSAAARDRLLAALAPARGGLLWRSSKADVAGELRLPPQRQASTALTLSAVERHFYDLAHDRTARFARSVLPAGLLAAAAAAARAGGANASTSASASASADANRPLTKDEERSVLAPLTALRQACIHPSIGSRGLRLLDGGARGAGGRISAAAAAAGANLDLTSSSSSPARRRRNGRGTGSALVAAAAAANVPMSMSQVLSAMTSKARLEAEDAQRVLLAALNGVAGARALSGERRAAAETYRRALSTLRANAAACTGVRADPLQRLHALTNLRALMVAEAEAEAGRAARAGGADGGADTVADSDGDGDIEAEAAVIREGYLAQWHARLAAAEADYEKAVEAVEKELARAASGGCIVEEEEEEEKEEKEEEEEEEEAEEGEGAQDAAPAAAAAGAAASRKRPSRAAAAAAASKKPKRQTHAGAGGGRKKGPRPSSSPLRRLAGAEHGGTSEPAGGWFLSAIDALQARGEEAASRSLHRLREEHEQADRYRSLASRNATSMAARLFRTGGGGGPAGGGGGVQGLARLKPLLVDELDRIAAAREEALTRLEQLRRRVAGGGGSRSSSSPSPDPALVAAAGGCGRCRGSELGARGAVCDHCRLDECFLAWELSLFALTTRAVAGAGARARGGGITAADAVRAAQAAALARVGRGGLGEEGENVNDAINPSSSRRTDGVSAAEVVRHPSEAERAMRVLRSEVARSVRSRGPREEGSAEGGGGGGEQALRKRSKKAAADAAEAAAAAALARVGGHALDALAALRDRLFLKARALALAQRGLLYAADELDMATTTLRLRGCCGGGGAGPLSAPPRGHEALYTLAPHELPHRAAELEAEAAAAEADLRRALGTLRYLTGLAEGGGAAGGEGAGRGGGGAAADGGGACGETAAAPPGATPAAAVASPPLEHRNNNPSAAPRVGMCPVCHDDFGQGEGGAGGGAGDAKKPKEKKELAMPPCAHALCLGCFRALVRRAQQRAFSCPTCRASTLPSDVRRVVFEEEEAEAAEEEKGGEGAEEEEKEDKGEGTAAAAPAPAPPAAAPQAPFSSPSSSVVPPNEASIPVFGDYGTKVEAVVRRIKAILAAADDDDGDSEQEEDAGAAAPRPRRTSGGGGRGGGRGARKTSTPASTEAKATTTKVLVFSTWVEALEIVAHALAANGVRAALAKGRAELGRTVAAFRKSPRGGIPESAPPATPPPRVLLLPAKQGAAGLNLTEAQHVVFLEPWLDPAAEAQAVGRVHRIGQSRATVRFLVFSFFSPFLSSSRARKKKLTVLPLSRTAPPPPPSPKTNIPPNNAGCPPLRCRAHGGGGRGVPGSGQGGGHRQHRCCCSRRGGFRCRDGARARRQGHAGAERRRRVGAAGARPLKKGRRNRAWLFLFCSFEPFYTTPNSLTISRSLFFCARPFPWFLWYFRILSSLFLFYSNKNMSIQKPSYAHRKWKTKTPFLLLISSSSSSSCLFTSSPPSPLPSTPPMAPSPSSIASRPLPPREEQR